MLTISSYLPGDVSRVLPIVEMLRDRRLASVRIDVDHVVHDSSLSRPADEPLGLTTIPLSVVAFQIADRAVRGGGITFEESPDTTGHGGR